ncbi:MAG: fumarylacetoacetate hydrolase family protein [Candidatus Nanopelagicales bacterium]|nr:fumarylacetoacetate hydrolase family protein [Candidatus Nanopelagicales bacterium]MCF8542003.1 fumarylacetoacetate hydrolase family protein [Candidatus Nanopelagicales bacterium]
MATRHGLARCEGDDLVVVDLPYPNVGALLSDGCSLDLVRRAAVRLRLPAQSLREVVIPPLPLRGTTVWGIGLNYHAKATLTGRAVPDFPTLYIKPLSALAGPTEPLRINDDLSHEVDYEAEVGILVGRSMDGIAPGDVWSRVAGIVTGNDVTARDLMVKHANPLLAKSMPGVSALGPTVVPTEDLAACDDIPVRSWLNGDLVQDSRTSDLITPVAELLALISRHARLDPGDVVLTGTPPGTGQDRGRFLRAGDEITIQVADMVPLVTQVQQALDVGTNDRGSAPREEQA